MRPRGASVTSLNDDHVLRLLQDRGNPTCKLRENEGGREGG